MSNLDSDFMTTTEACEVLGVSKTVIKRMADTGELETWKTPGGHRRLKRSAVLQIAEEKMGGIKTASERKKRKVKILVIDDDPVMNEWFSKVLMSVGVANEMDYASDGYEGLVKSGQKNYDMIFVDLNMPKLDGYEAVNALKASEKNHDSTIIVITALRDSEIDRTRLDSEVACLTKPLNIEVIKQFLRYESRSL